MSSPNSSSEKPHSEHPVDYPGLLGAWLAFTRPKTWGLTVAPVMAALALVWSEQHIFDPIIALFTVSVAVLMQMLTNMENDLGYTERKAEVGNRRGLPRATTRGWISVSAAKTAIRAVIVLGLLNTAVLIHFGGWVFTVVGIASIIAAYCYMGGPKPIAYTPFGECLVLIFFGLTSVCGTFYLQAGFVSLNAVLLSVALGCIASAVLAVNNFRDRAHDASVGRRTLAVVMSEEGFLKLFEAMIVLPYILVAIIVVKDMTYWPYFLVLASFPDCIRLPEKLKKLEHEALNEVMFACVKLEVKFCGLFVIGALIQSLLMQLTVRQFTL